MILAQHALVEDGEIRRRFERSVGTEHWGCPYHVVALPLPWFAGRIHQRWILFVYAGRLAVHIRFVFKRVENLNLVSLVARAGGCEEQPAVTARLAVARDIRRNSIFQMQLRILELAFGFDIAERLVDNDRAVLDTPSSRRVIIDHDPLIQVLAIE